MLKGLKSLVTGIIAGTAIGVLFAPDKGHKTRKKIKNEVKDGGTGFSSIKEALGSMGADMKDSYEDISEHEKVKAAKAKVKEAADKVKQKGEELYNENISAENRKKVTDAVKKAKSSVKKASQSAKKATSKAKKAVKKAASKKK